MLPPPHFKDVVSSPEFQVWSEEISKYVHNFETELIEDLAENLHPRSLYPRIVQGLVSREYLYQAEERGFYPLVDVKKLQNTCLLFAPLSHSQIERLTSGTHRYRAGDRQLPVKLRRSRVFLEREKELTFMFGDEAASSHVAKQNYLPELSFPFLPYSRKFLELELAGGSSREDAYHVQAHFSTDNLELEGCGTAHELGLSRDVIPVWNVRSTKLTVGPQVEYTDGMYAWRPHPDDPLGDKGPYILHCALDTRGNSVPIHLRHERVESELKFHVLMFSVINEIKRNPLPSSIVRHPVIGLQSTNVRDNFWYRIFLQAASLTRRDLDSLLAILPETQGRLCCVETRVEDCSEDRFAELLGEDRPFFDYLWYLDHQELTRQLGQAGIRLLSIHLEIMNRPPEDRTEEDVPYLLEDRANYFASICKLRLPMTFECRGYLSQ